jgi:hypothetical protein
MPAIYSYTPVWRVENLTLPRLVLGTSRAGFGGLVRARPWSLDSGHIRKEKAAAPPQAARGVVILVRQVDSPRTGFSLTTQSPRLLAETRFSPHSVVPLDLLDPPRRVRFEDSGAKAHGFSVGGGGKLRERDLAQYCI